MTVAGADPSETERIPALTGLRAVAAVWVLVFHICVVQGISARTGIHRGYLGVDLFFVLSGFILCHVYFADMAAGRARLRHYLLLRLGRLWPAHATVMLVWLLAFAVVVALGIPYDGNSHRGLAAYVAANLLMVHAWGLFDWYDLNPPSWSVSAEWFCYLAFPLMVPVVAMLRGAVTIVAAALVWVALAALVLRAVDLPGLIDYQRFGLVRAMAGFGLGMLAWRLGMAAPHLLPRHLADMALLAIVALVLAPGLRQGWVDYILLALFAALVLGLSRQGSATGRLLALRPVVGFGEISYSFYLVHWFALIVIIKLWRYVPDPVIDSPLAYGLCVGLASLFGAVLLHRLVERPARAAMRRHVRRSEPVPPAATAAERP